MKRWPVYVVVAAVVVAVAAQIAALSRRRPPSEAAELAELRRSVESLAGEVREVQAMLHLLLRKEAVSPVEAATEEEAEAWAEFPPPPSNFEPVDIVLEIDEAGGCTLDRRIVEWDELDGELKRVLLANPAMQLVVRPHEAVSQSEVVAVLEKARKAGIYRVSLATGGEEETSGGAE